MALRKIVMAIECRDDHERDLVQKAAEDISNMRVITGSDLLKMQSLFMQNRNELTSLFRMIRDNGIKSLLSIQGASIIRSLMKR